MPEREAAPAWGASAGGVVGVVAGGVGAGLGGGGGGASGGGCGGGLGASFVEYDCRLRRRGLAARPQRRGHRSAWRGRRWRGCSGGSSSSTPTRPTALSRAPAPWRRSAHPPRAAATVDHLPKRDAVAALSQASGLRPGLLARVYDHWRRKRSRRGGPLLRRLAAPTPAADTNPFHVFRPRERANRPQTRRRREGGDDGRERLLALSANLRKASELLELVARREGGAEARAGGGRGGAAGPRRDSAPRARGPRQGRGRGGHRGLGAIAPPQEARVSGAEEGGGDRGAEAERGHRGPADRVVEQRRARLRKRAAAARQSVNAVALMPPRPPPRGRGCSSRSRSWRRTRKCWRR